MFALVFCNLTWLRFGFTPLDAGVLLLAVCSLALCHTCYWMRRILSESVSCIFEYYFFINIFSVICLGELSSET